MKTIDLCMIAWPRDAARLEYMERSLGSFCVCCHASRHRIEIHVSLETLDVSTENFHRARDICKSFGAYSHWRNMPPSLGGNMNDALMHGYGDFKILTQDDWAWNGAINLSDDADFLIGPLGDDYAMVRYATFYTEFEKCLGVDFLPHDLKSVDMSKPCVYGDQPHMRRGDFAQRKSPTGGDPVGFYCNSPTGEYAAPEHAMAARLIDAGWKIAAYSPNVCDHIGSLSSCPNRRNAV